MASGLPSGSVDLRGARLTIYRDATGSVANYVHTGPVSGECNSGML